MLSGITEAHLIAVVGHEIPHISGGLPPIITTYGHKTLDREAKRLAYIANLKVTIQLAFNNNNLHEQ